jgi:hypothetical protein
MRRDSWYVLGKKMAMSRSWDTGVMPRAPALAIGRTRGPWPDESKTEIDEMRSGAVLERGVPEPLATVGNGRDELFDGDGDGSTSLSYAGWSEKSRAEPDEVLSPYSSSTRPKNPST